MILPLVVPEQPVPGPAVQDSLGAKVDADEGHPEFDSHTTVAHVWLDLRMTLFLFNF